MSILMVVLGFAVVLGPLVFVHELGHFLAAKRAGIRILEFGFGLPPRALTLWRGRGQLAVGGQRVAIPAHFKGLPDPDRRPAHSSVVNPPGATPQPGLDLGYVELVAERQANGSLTLRRLTMLDADQDDISPRCDAATREIRLRGAVTEYEPGTLYSLNWLLPLGGFVRMLGEEDPGAARSFAAAPRLQRTAVLLAGSLMNGLLAVVLLTAAWMVGFEQPDICHYRVVRMNANSSAAAAGILPGDLIWRVNGQTLSDCYAFSGYLRQRAGQQVSLEVERDGQFLTLPVALRADGQYDPAVEGPSGLYVRLEPLSWRLQRANLPQALVKSGDVMLKMVKGMLGLPAMLLSGLGLSSFMGPIGISQAGGEAIESSRQSGTLFPILSLIGQISLAVGMTNLLPFPALDGGRLVFVLIEWLRGRRIHPNTERAVHLVGMAVLLALMALISYGDIVRLASGQRIF